MVFMVLNLLELLLFLDLFLIIAIKLLPSGTGWAQIKVGHSRVFQQYNDLKHVKTGFGKPTISFLIGLRKVPAFGNLGKF